MSSKQAKLPLNADGMSSSPFRLKKMRGLKNARNILRQEHVLTNKLDIAGVGKKLFIQVAQKSDL